MDQVFSCKIQMPAGLEGQSRAKMRHRALEYVHIWSIYHFLMHISTATISKCSCITPNLTWFCNLGILFGSLTHIDGQYLGDILVIKFLILELSILSILSIYLVK
jgi:hypothetical protein